MLARLKEFLPAIKPTHVVYAYYEGNDFADLAAERSDPLLMAYLRPEFRQGLTSLQASVDRSLERFFTTAATQFGTILPGPSRVSWGERAVSTVALHDLRLYFLGGKSDQTAPGCGFDPPFDAENRSLFVRILAEAQRVTTEWGGTFHLLLIPELQRYLYPDQDGCYHGRDTVLNAARRLQIPTLDLVPLIGTAEHPIERMWTTPATHFSEAGYAVTAGLLAAHLRSWTPSQ